LLLFKITICNKQHGKYDSVGSAKINYYELRYFV